jgi:hypothetical protein
MIRKIWATLFLLTILLLGAPSAFAASECFTVASCGAALANPYTAGQFNACVVDVNGNTCMASALAPAGVTPISNSAAGSTGAVVATLPGAASKTTSICSFNVAAQGTGAIGPITVAGLAGGSQTFQLTAPGSLPITFTPCAAASATNTPITVTTTADASATSVTVSATGYQQ